MKENRKVAETVMMLTGYRHSETLNHGRRVALFVEIILKEVKEGMPELMLTEEIQERIVTCAMLHDLGKNALPDRVLYRQGRLNGPETEMFETHTLRGEEMAGMLALLLDRDYITCLKNICRYHHERYNGEGYPDGLKAEEIPFEAQVVGIADAFDDLVSDRLYKHPYTCEDACERIINGECGIFSPRLVNCFLRAKKELARAASDKTMLLL